MNPTPTPTPGVNWSNPQAVAKFREDALNHYGISPANPHYGAFTSSLDNYIGQNVQQYKNTVAGQAVYNAQGGVTTTQAQGNPQAAGQYLQGGGKLIPTGQDAQALALQQVQQQLDKAKGKNKWVSPDVYNQLKGKASGIIDSQTFDNHFQDKYVDPNNAFYDTPDAKAARGALPVIKQVVDSYSKLPKVGPGWEAAANIPIIGHFIDQYMLAQEDAHNKLLTGQIGNIRQIAGAGANQGFRFNLNELNNIAGMLPSAWDSKEIANSKLDQLNTFLKGKMGTDLHTVLKGQY